MDVKGVPKQDLPHLPVPPLQQTVDMFLKSVQPFLSETELQNTEKLCREFAAEGGVGEKLQKHLEERAEKTENWLAEWWLKLAYLGSRMPLPLHQSVGSLHPLRDPDDDQVAYVAAITAGILQFKKRLYAGEFPVEMLGPFPQDMSQFYYLLGSCRVPGEHEDKLRFLDSENPAEHILVIHNNRLFSVPVYDEAGEMLNQAQLIEQLRGVIAASPTLSTTPVGILTSERREVWYRAYQTLSKDPKNREMLEKIESSLFVICLDGPKSEIENAAPNRPTAGAIKMLTAGGGARGHAANRWYDKTFQLVLGEDGEMGVSFEHSASDGYVIGKMCDHAEQYWINCGGPSKDPVPSAEKFKAPEELELNVPNELRPLMTEALANMDKLAEGFEIHCIEYEKYGKEFIKSHGVSPDSYIQIALQLTFHRLHGKPTAQYEAAATRSFLHGRTETIRSCTPEAVAFVKAALDPKATRLDKLAAAGAAVVAHKTFAMKALGGEGVDRHLLGLRIASRELGMEEPKLFSDLGYIRSSQFRLSTSQVPLRGLGYVFFAPVVEDGYGVCYNPGPHNINISVSAYHTCPETSALKFVEMLEQTLQDMKLVLTGEANPSGAGDSNL